MFEWAYRKDISQILFDMRWVMLPTERIKSESKSSRETIVLRICKVFYHHAAINLNEELQYVLVNWMQLVMWWRRRCLHTLLGARLKVRVVRMLKAWFSFHCFAFFVQAHFNQSTSANSMVSRRQDWKGQISGWRQKKNKEGIALKFRSMKNDAILAN